MLEGDVSSPFAEAEAAESSEEEIASTKVAPERKQLDETIMKQSSLAQKKVIKRLFQTESFDKAYKQNARSKPVLFVPDKGDPVAYESMSAMPRVTGSSKAKLIRKSNFKIRGDIKQSSSAMNKTRLKEIIISADDSMFTAMQVAPLSGRTNKVQQQLLEAFIPEAPTGELVSSNLTSVEKSQQFSTTND